MHATGCVWTTHHLYLSMSPLLMRAWCFRDIGPCPSRLEAATDAQDINWPKWSWPLVLKTTCGKNVDGRQLVTLASGIFTGPLAWQRKRRRGAIHCEKSSSPSPFFASCLPHSFFVQVPLTTLYAILLGSYSIFTNSCVGQGPDL